MRCRQSLLFWDLLTSSDDCDVTLPSSMIVLQSYDEQTIIRRYIWKQQHQIHYIFNSQIHWVTITGLNSTCYHVWFTSFTCASDIRWFVSYIITPCFLHKLWSLNETENAVLDKLHYVVSKHVHGFKCKSNGNQTWSVVDMVMILSFLEQVFSNFGGIKVITLLTTGHISSPTDLYSNQCTGLVITFSDL